MTGTTKASAVPSLSRTALRGSAFEVAGYFSGQLLRLIGNLVLTRMLFPEAFGLAALVGVVTQGLTLMSDVGIHHAVVQNRRGDDERFLNTAWTIQVVRGAGLAAIALALALPFARIYDEPQLFSLLFLGAAQLFMSGFDSTALFSLRRRVSVGWLVALELVSQLVALIVMVVWASHWPTVWVLVAGGAVRPLCQTIGSHLLPVGYKNRFAWDAQAAREIRDFGRWIVGSSAIHFFGVQGDRLLLGHYLGAAILGVYSIAAYLADAVSSVLLRVTHGVLYPVFSRVAREGGIERLREVYYQMRARIDPPSMLGLGVLIVLGPWIVRLLWDERYLEAGWMLQVLTLKAVAGCILAPCDRCLLALGESRQIFRRSVFRTAALMVGMPVGWYMADLPGLLWATAASELSGFFALWPRFAELGLLRLRRELLALVYLAAGVSLGFLFSAVVGG